MMTEVQSPEKEPKDFAHIPVWGDKGKITIFREKKLPKKSHQRSTVQ